jgi:PAS domain S-box-containing protein
MLGTQTDITDLMQVQQDLQLSEERFQQVAANIDEVFWLTDAKSHHIVFVSPAYETVWGRTCASLYEDARGWIDAIHPDDRDEIARAYYGLASKGEFEREYRVVRPDGSIRWIHDNRFPVLAEGTDHVIRIAGIADDITERKQNEDALLDATSQLEQVNEVLKHQNEELTEFAHVASHDLKAPLRTLTAFADALEQELGGKLTSDAAEHLRRITTGAQQMQALVEDLLQFSRAGRKELTWSSFPLGKCVDQVLSALETQIKDVGAEIDCDKLPTVCADSVMLAQLYQNLIGNSLKFVGREKPKLRVTCETIDGQRVFGVKDNGIGIKPKFKDRVFEAFKRLHSDSK